MTQPLTTSTPTPETTPLTTPIVPLAHIFTARNEKGRSPTSGSFKKGHIPWDKGLSKETDARVRHAIEAMSKANTGREKQAWNKGIPLTPIWKQRLSIAHKGKPSPRKGKQHSEESRRKMSESQRGHPTWNKGIPMTEEQRRKNSESHKGQVPWMAGKHHKEETKRKLSEATKRYFASHPQALEEFHIHAIKSLQLKPNRKEQFLSSFLRDIGLNNLQFVGDGQLIIDGKNPDFADEKHRLLLELYGDYWHAGENPQDRIDFFKQRGYDCCVVWENELKHENLAALREKLLNFAGNGG